MKRIIIVLAVLGAILISSSLYTVNETQVAIKLRLGEIVSVENKPGLKFKTPFVNNVVSFDKRIQTLDSAAESFLTVEKKNVVVDSYVKWRIVDTEKFFGNSWRCPALDQGGSCLECRACWDSDVKDVAYTKH